MLDHVTLTKGRDEAYDELCKFDEKISSFTGLAINYAALGGNIKLLAKVLKNDDLNGYTEKNFYANEDDFVINAIRGGQVECVRLLLTHFEKERSNSHRIHKLPLLYLIEAVKQNKVEIVPYLLEQVSEKHLKTIKLSTTVAEKTDLSILLALKNKGVVFSNTVNAIIDKKEKRDVGILLSIGVILSKFSDFIKEKLYGTTGYEFDYAKFRALKARSKDDEPPPLEPFPELH